MKQAKTTKVSEAILRPSVLIIGSRYDLTCDYVVSQLRTRKISYFRFNSEDILEWDVVLDPINIELFLRKGELRVHVHREHLRSVFYRRAVFLREYGLMSLSPEEQLSKSQWLCFLRNLMVFSDIRWMNNPAATYYAEHKGVQLSLAKKLGFVVPQTLITNTVDHEKLNMFAPYVAVKGLDTVLLRIDSQEQFGFTTIHERNEISGDAIRTLPTILQDAVQPKLDIRVTVVGDQVCGVSITRDGKGIDGDWRKNKTDTLFSKYKLPVEIEQLCRQYIASLGLAFGAIDLVESAESIYFLEVNPTGEWAWLDKNADTSIAGAIVNWLESEA